MALTRQQVQENIDSLSAQGASKDDIEEYINSVSDKVPDKRIEKIDSIEKQLEELGVSTGIKSFDSIKKDLRKVREAFSSENELPITSNAKNVFKKFVEFKKKQSIDDGGFPTKEEIFREFSEEGIRRKLSGANRTEKEKKRLNMLITGAQVVSSFTPAGRGFQVSKATVPIIKKVFSNKSVQRALIKKFPKKIPGTANIAAIEGIGEFMKAKVNEESNETALKRAKSAAAVTLILGGALQGVKKVGGALVSTNLKQPTFSEETVKRVLKNPSLVNTPKKSFDVLQRSAFKNVKGLKRELGALVGKAKDAAGVKNDVIPLVFPVTKISAIKQREGLVASGIEAIERLEDPTAHAAFKVIDRIAFQVDSPKTKATFTAFQRRLDGIDASRPFQKIYNKMSRGESLTRGESVSIEARNVIRDSLNDSVKEVFTKKGLVDAKSRFSKLSKILSSPRIKFAVKDENRFGTVVKSSLSEGNSELFSRLRRLDDQLPKNKKFIDPITSKIVGSRLDDFSFNLFALQESTSILGKQLIKPRGILGTGTKTLVRRGLIEGMSTEDGDGLSENIESTVGSAIRTAPGAGVKAVKSLNEILFGKK